MTDSKNTATERHRVAYELARAVAAHAQAVAKAGLQHDSDHGIGEYEAIVQQHFAVLSQQRDELLTALKELAANWRAVGDNYTAIQFEHAAAAVEAIVAEAEGQ